MRVPPLIAIALSDQFEEATSLACAAFAPHADGNVAAAVERVDGIHEWSSERIVLGQSNRQQSAFTTRLQRVQESQRHDVVHIIAHVGIENNARWFAWRLSMREVRPAD